MLYYPGDYVKSNRKIVNAKHLSADISCLVIPEGLVGTVIKDFGLTVVISFVIKRRRTCVLAKNSITKLTKEEYLRVKMEE